MTHQEIEFTSLARSESRQLIAMALIEDLGSADPEQQRDITSLSVVPETARGSARFVSRESGVVCGLRVCQEVMECAGRAAELELHVADGARVSGGQTLASLRGTANDLLLVERTCLNFLGRLSGISTLTSRFVAELESTGARILDTRKTTPGWRCLEKYAVSCGGGVNHRMGLFDAVLIKDNHLAMMDLLTDEPLGEIRQAIENSRAWIDANADSLPDGRQTIVQIEVDTLEQLAVALPAGPDIVLLDNMDCSRLEEAVAIRNRTNPAVRLEASGGVTLETVGAIARTGVDRISAGALTHSAVNFDVGLDWVLE